MQQNEAGDAIEGSSEEDYWKQQIKMAKQKKVAAAQLLDTTKNDVV
jgi:hypothetical protein